MNSENKTIELSMEQFDEILKKWKNKGCEKAFGYILFSAFLTIILAFFDLNSSETIQACAAIYTSAAALSVFTE